MDTVTTGNNAGTIAVVTPVREIEPLHSPPATREQAQKLVERLLNADVVTGKPHRLGTALMLLSSCWMQDLIGSKGPNLKWAELAKLLYQTIYDWIIACVRENGFDLIPSSPNAAVNLPSGCRIATDDELCVLTLKMRDVLPFLLGSDGAGGSRALKATNMIMYRSGPAIQLEQDRKDWKVAWILVARIAE